MKGIRSAGQKTALTVLRAVIIGAVAGALICAALLAVFAFAFVSAENIPHDFLTAFMIAVTVVSSFLAGFITAKLTKQKGLLCGSISGVILFFLFLIAGVAISATGAGNGVLLRLLLMVISGGIGGLLAVNGKSRRK